MLQWNELRITPDGKHLIIDVQVKDMEYYEDVVLDSLQWNVYAKSSDFVSPMPDSNSTSIWTYNSTVDTQPVKRVKKIVDIDSINNNLFFVYAVASGEPASDTPCGCKDPILVGIVYNRRVLYKNSIEALKTMNSCDPSLSLIDYILNVKAFELSVKTGDYKGAIDYWNSTFKKNIVTNKPCGCYGT